ncbi:MAG: class I SAM-dependent RNA methyltransferase [Acidisphaera sp.]|nr:class I SAM-dependent RNA methyltransferase [Acidisphaera sp.]
MHFGACGGCSLQHLSEAAYRASKTADVATALTRAGFAPALRSVVSTGPGERRRADLAIRRGRDGITIGLHVARSTAIVDLSMCLVLAPAITALLQPLRAVLRDVSGLRREGSAVVNLLGTGPDLLLCGEAPLSPEDRLRLIAFARGQSVARLSWRIGRGATETICHLAPPRIVFAGVPVIPAPGAFLQASASGEAAIVAAVLAGLPERMPAKARIAELFAGSGTLTFPLARRVRVAAFEGDPQAAGALLAAARQSQLLGRITVAERDLARHPLAAGELTGLAAVVLDPPHAGAREQVREIARARVPRVVYVSCNPSTLGRDAALLAQAGYCLLSATPIDQFLWSTRIESVSVFAL